MFVDLSDMLKTLDREMALRRNVYRRRIAENPQKLAELTREYAVMRAVRKVVADLRAGNVVIAEWVDEDEIRTLLTEGTPA